MKEKIIKAVYSSIEEINKTTNQENPLSIGLTTKLFGGDSELDSLGLISLIVAVEQRVSEDLNISVTLADDRALSQEVSPFSSVQTLVDYIIVLANEAKNG